MERLLPVLGILTWLSLAYLFSKDRRGIDFPLVAKGLTLQISFVFLLLGIPFLGVPGVLSPLFDFANRAIIRVLGFSRDGAQFIFGRLVDTESFGFIFAFQVLPTIIFMSSLMALFYHLGLMQRVVWAFSWVMRRTLKTTGPETLAASANIFLGQTEAPLLVRPYLSRISSAELFTIMVSGMASVAGGVLAAYVGLLQDKIPGIAGHLLIASILSAPASLVLAKIIFPMRPHYPRDEPGLSDPKQFSASQSLSQAQSAQGVETLANSNPADLGLPEEPEIKAANFIEALAKGAQDGVKLAVNVSAMLLAFVAFIALVNGVLAWASSLLSLQNAATLQGALGLLFAPVSFLLGISWGESQIAGQLLGEKLVLNEFVAFLSLSQNFSELSERTRVILSYALCGFANFSSIAIQIGGIGSLVPSRRSEIAELGLRALLGGTLASLMTASFVSLLL